MVMNRRDFVRAGLGWAAAAGTFCLPGRATRLLAQADLPTAQRMRLIAGLPHRTMPESLAARDPWPPYGRASGRSRPERVLILHPRPASSVERGMPDILRAAHLSFDLHTWPTDCSHYRHALDAGHRLSSQKLVLIGRITARWPITTACRDSGRSGATRWHFVNSWARPMWVATSRRPQQFQHDKVGGRTIQTDNDLVDHWLVLIPHGTRDWDGWRDNLSVHVMLTHIFEEPGRKCGPDEPSVRCQRQRVFSPGGTVAPLGLRFIPTGHRTV